MNILEAIVTKNNAEKLIERPDKKSDKEGEEQSKEGRFEHKDTEGGRYQWVSYNPKSVIMITERPDGYWDISFQGALFPSRESPCLVDFTLVTEHSTLRGVRLVNIEAIARAFGKAMESILITSEEIETLYRSAEKLGIKIADPVLLFEDPDYLINTRQLKIR